MPDKPSRRVTQKEVAREAGVSHVTVSLALRGSRGIPASTRERIESIAKRMGYSPDPMLKALSAYRLTQKPRAFQASLGWLNTWPQTPENNPVEDFRQYFLSAKDRARDLGYGLDVFNLAEGDFKRQALHRVLAARDIRGLLVGPLRNSFDHIDLDWSTYSAVRLGYSMQDTTLHTVMNSQYRTAFQAVENMTRLGYRRIGYITQKTFEKRAGGHFLGGYLGAVHEFGIEEVPIMKMDSNVHEMEDVRSWLSAQKPDAVVAADHMIPFFESWGYSVPGDLGVATLSAVEQPSRVSGMNQNPSGVGQAAVNLVVSLLERQEVGVPATPMHVLIDGWWIPGKTLKKVARRS
jgi:LacI family transcriptional regulator